MATRAVMRWIQVAKEASSRKSDRCWCTRTKASWETSQAKSRSFTIPSATA